MNPTDGVLCYENCTRCSDSVKTKDATHYVINKVNEVECDNTAKSTAEHRAYDNESSIINSISENELVNEKSCDVGGIHHSDSTVQEESNIDTSKWKIIKGKFFMVNGANISCACARCPSGFSKYSHIGDGYVDLLIIRHTNMFNNLRLLLKLSSQSGDIVSLTRIIFIVDLLFLSMSIFPYQSTLPFVDIYRVRKFQFRSPATTQSEDILTTGSTQPIRIYNRSDYSQWNCDGEVIHHSDITVR